MPRNTLDLLCKVVDNYGDIGVVYRLARALAELDPELELRLLVDDLRAFQALAPDLDAALPLQRYRGWIIARWNAPDAPVPDLGSSRELFLRERPRRIVECFACGRPDWYEDILYDPEDGEPRLVLNLEYLTAEDYAVDFHLLAAVTRSTRVQKRFFMPGFTPGTAGLILDSRFLAARKRFLDQEQRSRARLAALETVGLLATAQAALGTELEEASWVLLFSYERDYGRVVDELAAAARAGQPFLALVAAGRSAPCFFRAWEAAGRPFPALALPFLPQEAWDELLLAADLSVVRGEESLSRAALSGRPFLWQAYLQKEAHQLVKLRALLERMRPWFPPEAFAAYEAASLAWNDRLLDGPGECATAGLGPLLRQGRLTQTGGPGLPAERALAAGFKGFSESLLSLGNLAEHLLAFFRDFR